MYIQLALLAFDKGGNPHRFIDLDKDKQNPNKPNDWYPCLFDKDGFVGPIWTKDERGKSVLLEAVDLVRMKSYHWTLEKVVCYVARGPVRTKPVYMYLTRGGEHQPVPELIMESLATMVWK